MIHYIDKLFLVIHTKNVITSRFECDTKFPELYYSRVISIMKFINVISS